MNRRLAQAILAIANIREKAGVLPFTIGLRTVVSNRTSFMISEPYISI